MIQPNLALQVNEAGATTTQQTQQQKRVLLQHQQRKCLICLLLPLAIVVVGSNLLYGMNMTGNIQKQLNNADRMITPYVNKTTTTQKLSREDSSSGAAKKFLNSSLTTPRRAEERGHPLSLSFPPKDNSTTTFSAPHKELLQIKTEKQEHKSYDSTNNNNNINNSSDDRLNIVLFYADDWTLKVLGKLNSHVLTPNLDQMANRGILFENSFVTTSVCWMSRATLMTGLYTSRHKHTKAFGNDLFQSHPWNQTLFPLLKSHGYYTGIVGKWHAPTKPKSKMKQAFDYTNLYYKQHWLERNGKLRHVMDLNGQDALEFLRTRPVDKKFALKISFFATHSWQNHFPSYNPMNDTRQIYSDKTTDSIPFPRTASDHHWNELPAFLGQETNMARHTWKRRWEPSYYPESIQRLYEMATEVDQVIGNVVDELKRQGVYDQTLLLFTTDNGDLHGAHGLAEKWYPFEESIQVPLIIQDPRMPLDVKGSFRQEFVLNVDLAPTLLGAAQIPPSPFMQGRDIGELYLSRATNRAAAWRADFFYEYNNGDPVTAKGHSRKYHGDGYTVDASFALITHDWKYIFWPQQDYEQLFHRKLDPLDEYDLLHKEKTTMPIKNNSLSLLLNDNNKTIDKVYRDLKERFTSLKKWVQDGNRV